MREGGREGGRDGGREGGREGEPNGGRGRRGKGEGREGKGGEGWEIHVGEKEKERRVGMREGGREESVCACMREIKLIVDLHAQLVKERGAGEGDGGRECWIIPVPWDTASTLGQSYICHIIWGLKESQDK